MNMQIVALIFVVTSFALLFFWVYKPSNRSRFDSIGRSIIDDDKIRSNSKQGGQS